MGKNQHSKDRMFITATEWATLYGGKKKESQLSREFKNLPFDCCALTFQPFSNPVCTKNGVIYDLVNIVPFIRKYGIDPATGDKIQLKDLIKLNFHKNKDDKYHCPVTFKVFNEHTRITAVKTSGHVYAYEAIDQYNVKAKHWHDLMTDEPFKRSDLIDLQDPQHPEKNNFAAFYHVKNKGQLKDVSQAGASQPTSQLTAAGNNATSDVMKELDATEASWKTGPAIHSDTDFTRGLEDAQDNDHAAHYSTGEVSASFTSTHMSVRTRNRAAALEDDVVRYGRIKGKGYVRLKTSFGDINLELYCEQVPKTCENFLLLCRRGYYNNTIFHRLIRNFMIQGGDPTGTGKGGESAFADGKPFKDEFVHHLSHKGRGVLSMANAGPNTNRSQFFLTFRSCQHLDKKHTVFGQVVGGMDTLNDMERVPTDDSDHPQEEIKILKTEIFEDPFAAAEEAAVKERAEAAEKKKEIKKAADAANAAPKKHHSGVGQYISPAQLAQGGKRAGGSARDVPSGDSSTGASAPMSAKFRDLAAKRAKQGGGFGSFAGW
ncbi:uncharacterized protein MONBRDRAFT_34157 [Monosiga brevicollis MX1]|uniref:RING-type E3 ubiquitin-protein ligase PPIL2 n=1 Tax=Monosiga brevicollis TaxID=81824 RepID=A9V9X6_MONBE|nr:uncharacterized protein MONBRDRAFT_34157 [Monosiga brevicollis MX1]EDQ85563.1 predicted protein [Monosiga brevicollis MX1]|eukprot:XP_001749512.1 hypothetical protein [Monosiga brevicollis MX1]